MDLPSFAGRLLTIIPSPLSCDSNIRNNKVCLGKDGVTFIILSSLLFSLLLLFSSCFVWFFFLYFLVAATFVTIFGEHELQFKRVLKRKWKIQLNIVCRRKCGTLCSVDLLLVHVFIRLKTGWAHPLCAIGARYPTAHPSHVYRNRI